MDCWSYRVNLKSPSNGGVLEQSLNLVLGTRSQFRESPIRGSELMNPKYCIRIVSDMYQWDKIRKKLGQCVFGAIVGR